MNSREARREAHRMVALLIHGHLANGEDIADDPADRARIERALLDLAAIHDRAGKGTTSA